MNIKSQGHTQTQSHTHTHTHLHLSNGFSKKHHKESTTYGGWGFNRLKTRTSQLLPSFHLRTVSPILTGRTQSSRTSLEPGPPSGYSCFWDGGEDTDTVNGFHFVLAMSSFQQSRGGTNCLCLFVQGLRISRTSSGTFTLS